MVERNINNLDYIFTCSKCKIDKKNSEFQRCNSITRNRKFTSHCKECLKQYDKNRRSLQSRKDFQKLRSIKYRLKNKEKYAETSRNSRNKNWINRIYHSTKTNATRRNIQFNISKEDISNQWITQNSLCFYTKDIMIKEGYSRYTVSVDRVNNNLGYTKDNIALCCKYVNIMKNDASIEQLKDFCLKITNNKNI